MRKLALLIATCVLAVTGVAVSVAGANPGNGTVPFTVIDDVFDCKGVRIVTGGPNPSVRDLETCRLNQQLLPEGKYTIVPSGEDRVTTVRWYSDYEAFVNPGGVFLWAVSGTLIVKNGKDGTQVWLVHATY